MKSLVGYLNCCCFMLCSQSKKELLCCWLCPPQFLASFWRKNAPDTIRNAFRQLRPSPRPAFLNCCVTILEKSEAELRLGQKPDERSGVELNVYEVFVRIVLKEYWHPSFSFIPGRYNNYLISIVDEIKIKLRHFCGWSKILYRQIEHLI